MSVVAQIEGSASAEPARDQDPSGRSGRDRRSRHARARRNIALPLSIVAHAAAFLAMFGSMQGELVSAPEAASSASPFAVTLVTLPTSSETASSSAKSLAVLAARFETGAAPVYVSKESGGGGLEALSARLRLAGAENTRPGLQNQASSHWPRPPTSEAVASPRGQAAASAAAAGSDGQAGASASTGGLWGRIAPCWRTPAKRSKVPVTLEVAIDGAGNLSKPPRILRDASSNNEPQLAAEAAALAALAACLPRNDIAFGNRTYRLEFRPE